MPPVEDNDAPIDPFTPGQYQDYIENKKSDMFYIDPLSDLRPDLEASDVVNSPM